MKRVFFFLIPLIWINTIPIMSQSTIKLRWSQSAPIPAAIGEKIQPGLAGPVAGLSNGHLIVAGGANFPDALPWNGGVKTYHREIYLMKPVGHGRWMQSGRSLPKAVAYSASTGWNNRILSVGGEDSDGPVNRVWSLACELGEVVTTELTPLPIAVTAAHAAVIGNTLYIAGGQSASGATEQVWAADLTRDTLEWTPRAPLPVALAYGVMVASHDGKEECLFLFGGRNKTGPLTTFWSAIWKYTPSKNRWEPAGELAEPGGRLFGLSAGTGIAAGEHGILIMGGDRGILFNQTEEYLNKISEATDETKRKELVTDKNRLLESHPGFRSEVIYYDTRSCRIRFLAPHKNPLPVTTVAVSNGETFWIPSGEIRPGVRTPAVLSGTLRIR